MGDGLHGTGRGTASDSTVYEEGTRSGRGGKLVKRPTNSFDQLFRLLFRFPVKLYFGRVRLITKH